MTTQFSSLPLNPQLQHTLASLEFVDMTPIQQQALPFILKGADVIGQAQTGSGKTAAFTLGVLNTLSLEQPQIQALIICPTRELADQVAKEVRRLGRSMANLKVLTLCGGTPIGPQKVSLERPAHIIVGTPGRLVDHLSKNTLNLSHLKHLVLDEADRMLDMGFSEQLNTIIAACPKQKQTLLFSATFPEDIASISRRCQKNPQMVVIEQAAEHLDITQHFYEVRAAKDKPLTLLKLLAHFRPASSLIFCNTKQTCNELLAFLQQHKIVAQTLHGDLDQKQRDQVLVCFANRSLPILIATDVAARGLDIKQLDAVINYELAREAAVHIHRIGRTGRAGEAGLALNLVTPAEAPALARIEDLTRAPVRLIAPPNSKNSVDLQPQMVTLAIDGGKKAKLRAGDVLGALTKDGVLIGEQVGKIALFDFSVYVAVHISCWQKALQILQTQPIKGRQFKARRLF